jgi:hypothetical protein
MNYLFRIYSLSNKAADTFILRMVILPKVLNDRTRGKALDHGFAPLTDLHPKSLLLKKSILFFHLDDKCLCTFFFYKKRKRTTLEAVYLRIGTGIGNVES